MKNILKTTIMGMVSRKGEYVLRPVITLEQFKHNQYEKKFVQAYHEAMVRLLHLSQNQQCLLMYCIDKMSEKNTIVITGFFIDEMNQYYLEKGIIKEAYKINTVQQGLAKLCELDIMERLGRSGYVVNPVLFFKFNEEARNTAIEMYLSFGPRGDVKIRIDDVY